jgi:hypothetical protein
MTGQHDTHTTHGAVHEPLMWLKVSVAPHTHCHILDLQHSPSRRLNSDFVNIQLRLPMRPGDHAIFGAGVQLYTRARGYARIPGLLIPSLTLNDVWFR